VTRKQLTSSLIGSVSKTYDSTTNATLSSDNFNVSGWVNGEGASITQTAGSYASANVNANGGSGTVSSALLSSDFSANTGTVLSNYTLPSSAVGNVGTITAAPLTVKVGNTAAFVTQDARTAIDTGISYSGWQGADSATSALVQVPVVTDRTYTGSSNTPSVGTYTNVYGLSFTPVAQHGNYSITLQKGDLTVVPADKLLITMVSQNDTYGNRTASNAAQANTVIAQYCLVANNCNGANIYNLSMVAGAGNHWSGTDNTQATIQFDTTTLTSGNISTGGYLKAGNYSWDVSNLTSSVSGQFNGSYVNSGTLTIDKLVLSPSASAVSKIYDGTTSAAGITLNTPQTPTGDKVNALSGSGSYTNRNVIANDTVTFGNLSLQGADKDNYALAVMAVQGTGSITPKFLTLAAVNDTKTYDGTVNSDKSVVVTGLVSGDSVSNISQSFASKNVLGSNASTLRVNNGYIVNDGNGGSNYIVGQQNAVGTIIARSASVVATGARKVFSGLSQSLDPVQTTGFLASDSITISGLAAGTMPGQYTTQLAVTGADASNYNITYENATLEILPVTGAINLWNTPPVVPIAAQTRIAYRGITRLNAIASAVAGQYTLAEEPVCGPEKSSDCTCAYNPALSVEICTPGQDKAR
jgi:hypothetical protein